jgi:cysteine desulfurase / selenocysteine lyase
VIGTSDHKVAVISFVVDGVHHYDIGTLLDKQGVAVRTGHHCTEPLWESLGLTGSVRASFSIYNTESDADRFVAALEKSLSLLRA